MNSFSDTQDIIRDFNPIEGDQIEFVVHTNPEDITTLDQLYADTGAKIILVTNNTDHTNNGELDTVFHFDRWSTGVDDSDFLLILEGFTAPILFDYFNPVSD